MVTNTVNGDAAEQSLTGEISAQQHTPKKSVAKKTAAEKKTAKKGAAKKAVTAGASKSAGKKRAISGATAQRQQAKAEEERAHYLVKIEANELRLRDSKTSNEQPLTPEQIKTTQDILTRQREHLAELESFVTEKSDDPRI